MHKPEEWNQLYITHPSVSSVVCRLPPERIIYNLHDHMALHVYLQTEYAAQNMYRQTGCHHPDGQNTGDMTGY